MNNKYLLKGIRFTVATCLSIIALTATDIHGQVTPEFGMAARGVFSGNFEDRNSGSHSAVSDFSDSGLLLGLRQKLYSNWRSRFVMGMQFPDADSELGQVFYHQVFIQVENLHNIIKFGRSRVKGSLIEFPTLRDDDALRFTEKLNPFATGKNTEDSQYGNVLEYTRIFGKRVWLTAHGEHYAESVFSMPNQVDEFGLNSAGVNLEYRVPASQRWNRGLIQYIGVAVNAFFLEDRHLGPERSETLINVIAATIINIHPDPVNFWDFRVQGSFTNGLTGMKRLRNEVDLARAQSSAIYASLRYLRRTLERPSIQVTLSGGYKIYPELYNSSHQVQVTGNVAVRIGDGLDLVTQALYEKRNGQVRNFLGEDRFRFQIGFVYSLEQIFNSQFGDRGSLLNLEHDYIP